MLLLLLLGTEQTTPAICDKQTTAWSITCGAEASKRLHNIFMCVGSYLEKREKGNSILYNTHVASDNAEVEITNDRKTKKGGIHRRMVSGWVRKASL